MFPEARGIEFLIIAALALIVVGPKELPGLLRKLGQFVGKMRNIANEFRASFDEMARQSELDDLRKQVEEMRSQANQAAAYDPTGADNSHNDYHPEPEAYAEPEPEPEPEPVKAAPRKRASPKAAAKDKPAPAKSAAAKSAPAKAVKRKSPKAAT